MSLSREKSDFPGSCFGSRAVRLRELCFLPGKCDAVRAVRLGIVEEVIPNDQFHARTEEVMDRLMSYSPRALKVLKVNFLAAERLGLRDYIALETDRHELFRDSREAVDAFREIPPMLPVPRLRATAQRRTESDVRAMLRRRDRSRRGKRSTGRVHAWSLSFGVRARPTVASALDQRLDELEETQ